MCFIEIMNYHRSYFDGKGVSRIVYPIPSSPVRTRHEHYIDVIMTTMTSQITRSTVFTQPFIQTQIKENIKTLRHWPLCGDFTGTGEFPAQRSVTRKMFPFDDVVMSVSELFIIWYICHKHIPGIHCHCHTVCFVSSWLNSCWGPFYLHGSTLIPAWISNYIHNIVCDELTYPFPKLQRCNCWSLGMDK